jgi:IS30 family transposase
VRLVHAALGTSIDRLQPGDRLRLRSYYVLELTLAEIGRVTGEHEATVSRHLSRTRRVVRESAERLLREDARLSEAEIARGFELALEDPGGLNAEELFSPKFT